MNLLSNTDKLKIENLKNIIIKKYPTLVKENIKAFFFKQLKTADIITANKNTTSKNNTTHIACTGPSRTFFYEAYGNAVLNDYRTDSLTRTIPIFIESKYISSQTTNSDFVKSDCAIWAFPKENGNQIGLSKVNLDSPEFRELRANIFEKDVLIFFKYISSEKDVNIYTLLLQSTNDFEDIESLELNTRSQYWEDISNNNIILETDTNLDVEDPIIITGVSKKIIGINKMFLGAPGTGKSNFVHNNYYIGKHAKRVTFHPEYTYYDFVGSIKPCVNSTGGLTYEFVPGVFTEILAEAFKNPCVEFNLIIEELNRANTAAVFGDLFQLLDRNSDGSSEYPVSNRDIVNYINKSINTKINELIIPNNLNIIATMNSSDQNIFIMDTAFKRRWDVEYISIKFDDNHLFKNSLVPGMNLSWELFVTRLNSFILSSFNADLMISEDKQLGPYFIKEHDLNDISRFSYKIFLYLWDDVFKMDRYRIFNLEIRSFSQLVKLYKNSPQSIFSQSFLDLLPQDTFNNEAN